MRKFLIRLLFRLADYAYRLDYIAIDKKAVEQWLYESFQDKGFIDYFKLEDLKMLKTLAGGLDKEKYWLYVGRRLQLLYLYNDMRKSFELRKARQAREGGEKNE